MGKAIAHFPVRRSPKRLSTIPIAFYSPPRRYQSSVQALSGALSSRRDRLFRRRRRALSDSVFIWSL